MVVTRHEGRTSLTVRGPETRATTADFPAYGEWFAIRFKLGTLRIILLSIAPPPFDLTPSGDEQHPLGA